MFGLEKFSLQLDIIRLSPIVLLKSNKLGILPDTDFLVKHISY